MFIVRIFRILGLIFILSTLVFPAMAQEAQDTSSQQILARDNAASEQDRFQKEEEARKTRQALEPKSSQDEVENPPEVPDASGVAGVKFRMNDIRLVGNDQVPTEELQPILGLLLNRDVNLAEIQDVVTKIKQHYRSKGFIATYVYVPPQKIREGIVEIRIMESKLGTLDFTGNRWVSNNTLSRAFLLKRNQAIQYEELHRGLQKLNKHRDIKAKAVLKPGLIEGHTDIEIKVQDKFPLHFSGEANNLGTPNTGKTRAGITMVHTNVTGRMDQASGRFQMGRGAWAAGADYAVPLNRHETKVGFAYQRSAVRVGGPFSVLGIRGAASTYTPYVIQPLTLTKSIEATARLAFDIKEIENRVLGKVTGHDSLRISNWGISLDQTDRFGKTFSQQTFLLGFSGFLGASSKTEPAAARAGSGGQFSIYRGSLARYQKLPLGLVGTLRGGWQLSNDVLPSSEQLRLGGTYSVRGFEESEYVADYGGSLSAEIHIPSYFFPKDWKLPYFSKTLREQIKGTAFVDFGSGALRKTPTGGDGQRNLVGAGGGMRIHLFDKVFARLEWAKPVGMPGAGKFYFGVTAEVF